MLSIFWSFSLIFTDLLNRWNLWVRIAATFVACVLYFSHWRFHLLLWYRAIATRSLVEIIERRCLHVYCISASWWIETFRNTVFLMTEKWEKKLLILIKWARMSSHARLVFCVLSLIQLRKVVWFCILFKWTCREFI